MIVQKRFREGSERVQNGFRNGSRFKTFKRFKRSAGVRRAPTIFPGVLAREEATTLVVGEGELQRADFALPQKLARVRVSGTVSFADGTPAAGKDVRLVAGNYGVSSGRTNESGQFTLTGLSGSTYSVRVWFNTSPEHNGSAEETISLGDEPVTDLKLVLKRIR
jgi:hypothetical protein